MIPTRPDRKFHFVDVADYINARKKYYDMGQSNWKFSGRISKWRISSDYVNIVHRYVFCKSLNLIQVFVHSLSLYGMGRVCKTNVFFWNGEPYFSYSTGSLETRAYELALIIDWFTYKAGCEENCNAASGHSKSWFSYETPNVVIVSGFEIMRFDFRSNFFSHLHCIFDQSVCIKVCRKKMCLTPGTKRLLMIQVSWNLVGFVDDTSPIFIPHFLTQGFPSSYHAFSLNFYKISVSWLFFQCATLRWSHWIFEKKNVLENNEKCILDCTY